MLSWVLWCKHVVPALEKLRLEDVEFIEAEREREKKEGKEKEQDAFRMATKCCNSELTSQKGPNFQKLSLCGISS
jgi:hypothetical protein